tara:strand:+ start:1589 stop:1882 length:294 start_codon:yes stop_codon:yes gene_type:complete
MAVRSKEHRNVVDEVARLNKVEIEFLWEVLKNSMIPGKNIHIAYDVINKLRRQHQLSGVDKKDLKLSKDRVVNPKTNEEKAQEILKGEGGELFVKDE